MEGKWVKRNTCLYEFVLDGKIPAKIYTRSRPIRGLPTRWYLLYPVRIYGGLFRHVLSWGFSARAMQQRFARLAVKNDRTTQEAT